MLHVRVRGNKIPAKIFGKFSILCAILRQLYLSVTLLFEKELYDVIIMDLLSFSIPILRWKCLKLLFYCHFPDKLLAARHSFLRKVYRIPFDWIEGFTMSMADKVLVNSYFTASIVSKTFPNIKQPVVLYPSINVCEKEYTKEDLSMVVQSHRYLVLSINRFEKKKDIALAIKSFYHLKSEPFFDKCCLVIAGIYCIYIFL